ncbi:MULTISPECIES: XRE family transcriptional regulator [Dietzia]|jgi:transcriptional regulator with XRE-family HTH domain|uniref:XRE family transcriptional regulator n=1 Tax=Dietzia aurantiaca TaxID=983873 RepID=A0ABV9PNJ0_9ACTN|nr:XRE family transcriptional regulator [Dietzia massiliensis]MBS7547838.1 XRE family transcriptional regulator [Dietzia massiliensis]
METPHLVELIDAHKRAYGISEAELARRIGITRQNLHLWRTHGLRGLPARTTLNGMAAELRLPYVRILEAALRDVGYLDATDGLSGLLA